MRAFAYQWKQSIWKERIEAYRGKPVPYCASAQFSGAGVVAGDALYVLGLGDGRESLLVIGRFIVASRHELLEDGDATGACLTEREARTVLGDEAYGVPLFRAPWYLLPQPGSATLMRFDREVPLDPPLLFGKPGETPRSLFLDPDGRVNKQAVRSISRMRPATVAALDRVLTD